MEMVKPVNPHAAAARMDNNGDEAVITLDPLRKNLQNLMDLKNKADNASVLLGEAIKATAGKTGLMAATVRALINARSKDKVQHARRSVEQLSIVFDEFDEEETKAISTAAAQ